MLRIHMFVMVHVQHLAKAVLLFCSPILELVLPQAFSKAPTISKDSNQLPIVFAKIHGNQFTEITGTLCDDIS